MRSVWAPASSATALALAVPAAGGVQRTFGADAKSLQVGFAVEAGLRAARLAAAGASVDTTAVDAWLGLLGGTPTRDFARTPSVPGGLAAKLHPCCYAMQRPIAAVSGLAGDLQVADVKRVLVRTPEGSVTPLIHHRPTTSLEAKFSLEYAVAVSLLRPYPGIDAFTDAIVTDPNLHHLLQRVEVELTPGGQGLLDGVFEVEAQTQDATRRATCALPPGAPGRPPTDAELRARPTSGSAERLCRSATATGRARRKSCTSTSPNSVAYAAELTGCTPTRSASGGSYQVRAEHLLLD